MTEAYVVARKREGTTAIEYKRPTNGWTYELPMANFSEFDEAAELARSFRGEVLTVNLSTDISVNDIAFKRLGLDN